jgi:hypothetical protein
VSLTVVLAGVIGEFAARYFKGLKLCASGLLFSLLTASAFRFCHAAYLSTDGHDLLLASPSPPFEGVIVG